MGGIVAEQPYPRVRDGADLPRDDQLSGRDDCGRVAIVEPDGGLNACFGDGVGDRPGVLGRRPTAGFAFDDMACVGALWAAEEVRTGSPRGRGPA